jgi:hypothetical protein
MSLSEGARGDRAVCVLAGLAVATLGGISAAISYTHTVRLAELHGEDGWRAHTLPLSVDGLEVVASLVLLVEHRTRHREGRWLPWLALAAGTIASLAANVLVAEPTAVGRTISAWPAVAFLVGIKLGSRMLSRPSPGPERPAFGVAGTTETGPDRCARAGPVPDPAPGLTGPRPEQHAADPDGVPPELTVTERPAGPGRSTSRRRKEAVTWCLLQHQETGYWPTGTAIAQHWQFTDRNGRKVRAAAQAAHRHDAPSAAGQPPVRLAGTGA